MPEEISVTFSYHGDLASDIADLAVDVLSKQEDQLVKVVSGGFEDDLTVTRLVEHEQKRAFFEELEDLLLEHNPGEYFDEYSLLGVESVDVRDEDVGYVVVVVEAVDDE